MRRQSLFILLLFLWTCGFGAAQPDPPLTPVPLADSARLLQVDRDEVINIQSRLHELSDAAVTENELRRFEQLVSPRAEGASLEELRQLQEEWRQRANQLASEQTRLDQEIAGLDADVSRLETMASQWQAYGANDEAPPELRREARLLSQQAEQLRKAAERSRSLRMVLANRTGRQQSRVKSVLDELNEHREHQVGRAFRSRVEALWNSPMERLTRLPELQSSLARQMVELESYASGQADRLILHGFMLFLLVLGLRWARRKMEDWLIQEPALQTSAAALRQPLWTGLLLAVLLNPFIHPEAPKALRVVLGFLAILPANLLLRQVLSPKFRPLLSLLLLLFITDQLRTLTADQELLTRLLFGGEMLVCGVVLALVVRRQPASWLKQAMQVAALLALSILTISVLGFVDLGYLLGDALLTSAYLGVFLLALLQILNGLFAVALRVPPLALLHSVSRCRSAWRRRFHSVAASLLGLAWTLALLERLALREPFWRALVSLSSSGLRLGAVHLTVAGFFWLLVSLRLAVLFSRFLRFALDQDVYPRTHLDRGVTYTLSTLTHYGVLSFGLLLGLAGLGLDTGKFVVVAGALGVGIGFGLQNIVNNFVSGLILLFERPIRVGDFVDLSGRTGTLQSIGLRASRLRTLEGADVIVPNGEILSQQITNWTASDQLRRLVVDVGVAYGTPANQVLQLLLDQAGSHPDILPEPPPEAVFLKMNESSIDFQLRAWTEQFGRWAIIHSELTQQVYTALNEAQIEIPYPQRTVHIVN